MELSVKADDAKATAAEVQATVVEAKAKVLAKRTDAEAKNAAAWAGPSLEVSASRPVLGCKPRPCLTQA
jgi:hypothetical protein